MDLTTFVGRTQDVPQRLRQLMDQVQRVQTTSAYRMEGASIVLDVPQGETEHAGCLVLHSPMGRRVTYRGAPGDILAHDVRPVSSLYDSRYDPSPASHFFGDNADRLLQNLWEELPEGYALHAAPDQAVLAGPDGLWMVQYSKKQPLTRNGDQDLRADYEDVPVPDGFMAVSGSRHARMEFLDSSTGQSLLAQWGLSDIVLPHADQDRFTVMLRQRGQSVLCSAGSSLNILGAWRDANS